VIQEPMLIIITGSPGTGKSRVATELARIFTNCRILESSELARKLGVALRDPTGRDTYVIKHSGEVRLTRAILEELDRIGCLLLVTTYPLLFLERLQHVIPIIILLRTEPEVLYKRLESRGWRLDKIAENVLAEAFNVIPEELREFEHAIIEVDTTNTNPEESAFRIVDKLVNWDVGIRIDWLSKSKVLDLIPKLLRVLDAYRDRFLHGGSDQ